MTSLSDNEVRDANNLPEFFKIYIPALSSKMMRIPPDFIDKFGGDIPTSCTLKRPPLGGCWEVGTSIIDDDWFFVKGWPEFVQQNSLKDADFLVFCLVGNSTFCVTIFSPNGCLKDEYPSRRAESERNNVVTPTKSKSKWKRKRERLLGWVNGNPCFTRVMVKSNKDGSMVIPREFWNLYMRKKIKESPTMATLCFKKNTWTVTLRIGPDRVKFCGGGYAKFIQDASLRVGASYTFELIRTNPFSFRVTPS